VLILRLVFHLALRQAEGFATSALRMLGQELRVPGYTTLSRRSRGFAGRRPGVVPHGTVHLAIDSTGLKLFGRCPPSRSLGAKSLRASTAHGHIHTHPVHGVGTRHLDVGEVASTKVVEFPALAGV